MARQYHTHIHHTALAEFEQPRDDVKELQTALNTLGYKGHDDKPLDTDGLYYRHDGHQSNTDFATAGFMKSPEFAAYEKEHQGSHNLPYMLAAAKHAAEAKQKDHAVIIEPAKIAAAPEPAKPANRATRSISVPAVDDLRASDKSVPTGTLAAPTATPVPAEDEKPFVLSVLKGAIGAASDAASDAAFAAAKRFNTIRNDWAGEGEAPAPEPEPAPVPTSVPAVSLPVLGGPHVPPAVLFDAASAAPLSPMQISKTAFPLGMMSHPDPAIAAKSEKPDRNKSDEKAADGLNGKSEKSRVTSVDSDTPLTWEDLETLPTKLKAVCEGSRYKLSDKALKGMENESHPPTVEEAVNKLKNDFRGLKNIGATEQELDAIMKNLSKHTVSLPIPLDQAQTVCLKILAKYDAESIPPPQLGGRH